MYRLATLQRPPRYSTGLQDLPQSHSTPLLVTCALVPFRHAPCQSRSSSLTLFRFPWLSSLCSKCLCISVQGCCNKALETDCLKQQKMYCLPVFRLEVQNQGFSRFALRAVREKSVPSPSPWLINGYLLVSFHLSYMCLFVHISPFYKNTILHECPP